MEGGREDASPSPDDAGRRNLQRLAVDHVHTGGGERADAGPRDGLPGGRAVGMALPIPTCPLEEPGEAPPWMQTGPCTFLRATQQAVVTELPSIKEREGGFSLPPLFNPQTRVTFLLEAKVLPRHSPGKEEKK